MPEEKNGKLICVYIETSGSDKALSEYACECIGAARQLMEDSGSYKISALLIGAGVRQWAAEIIRHGVDEVWLVDSPFLPFYAEDARLQIAYELIKRKEPDILLGSGSEHARSLFPRLAVRLNTGLCADCIDLKVDAEHHGMIVTRPAFGGNVMAKIVIPQHRPQMATLKEKAFERAKRDEFYSGAIYDYSSEFSLTESIYRLIHQKKIKEEEWFDLGQADTIVAVGRGIGQAGNLTLISKLANVLGGDIGCTRPLVEQGLMHASRQIGQTGIIVRPRLYIACGISGALQHVIGMEKSNFIVAINADQNAPIFEYASYGIVGDLLKVIPDFIHGLEESKSGSMALGS
ncbi:Acryloyl-CoA reductase electron transfer subunit beta [compost metagenome]